MQRRTTASYTYHYYTSIDKLRHQSLYTSSCRQTELKTMLSSYFYDVKMRVKQSCERKHIAKFLLLRTAGWHRNRLCLFIMEIIAYKGRPLTPFLLMDLYLILHYYSCTATTLYCHFRNIEVESNDGSHLESLGALGPGRRIFKKCALAR